ncbi:MAG: DUF815 domain-containing protein [Candidatus Latescibacteria bacterium]|nr:DUF815 domain-containing protein [Candidatus Latescibacterota bacterium]
MGAGTAGLEIDAGEWQKVQRAQQSLSRFCSVLQGEGGQRLEALRQALEQGGEGRPQAWAALQHWCLQQSNGESTDLTRVMVDRLLADGHLFLRHCEERPIDQVSPALWGVMRDDLRALQVLARAPWAEWAGCPQEEGEVNPVSQSSATTWDLEVVRQILSERFFQTADWGQLAELLGQFVHRHGRPPFAGTPAFRLSGEKNDLQLVPLDDFAAFPLEWLEGNEDRIALVERNTQQWLAGYPANNVLIWGPRGSGKSTLIRALITKYYQRGLRGIEIPPNQYGDLPALFSLVRQRREFYIGVLDNIAVDRSDASFRQLARGLEGTLERAPRNLVFYATSNFKDLIDRQGERGQGLGRMQMDDGPEVEPNIVNQGKRPEWYDPQLGERLDEQRALDDRFALKVFMDMPRKRAYEQMVLSYARRAGIEEEEETLLALFNRWRMRHNHDLVGGRTARDFIVDYYPEYRRKSGDQSSSNSIS